MNPEPLPPSPWLSFIPLLILTVPAAIVAFVLAREKGRSVTKWTLLGAIPFIGFPFVWYFVGAANWKKDEKLDRILALLQKDEPST